MKKYILGLMFGLLLIGSPVYAEDVASLSLQQEYQKALVQLIELLQLQVTELIKQLNDIKATQIVQQQVSDNVVNKIDTIVQNTTPVVVTPDVVPVFGAIEPVPELVASCTMSQTNVPQLGKYTFTVNASGGTGSYSYYWTGATNERYVKTCNASFSSDGTMKIGDSCFIDMTSVRADSTNEDVVVKSGTVMKRIVCK